MPVFYINFPHVVVKNVWNWYKMPGPSGPSGPLIGAVVGPNGVIMEELGLAPNTSYFVQVTGPFNISGSYTTNAGGRISIINNGFVTGSYDINILDAAQSSTVYSAASVTLTFAPPSGGGGGVGTGGGGAVCFLGSAPVLTPAGWARIDSLAVGDLVRTADGRDVAIQRVKHQRIDAPSAAVNPYVIPAGQYGATENLAISPRHCVAVSGRGMVEARFLGLKQMPMRAAFDYYNLELPEWDNMVVAGVEVESLAPKKRVVMTVEQLAKLAAGIPVEKLTRMVTVLADGKVAMSMTRKERRMCA